MDPGILSAFAFPTYKKLGGITSRQPAVLVYNLRITSPPPKPPPISQGGCPVGSHHLRTTTDPDPKAAGCLGARLEEGNLGVKDPIGTGTRTVPEDGPIPKGGGYGVFLGGSTKQNHKVPFFQGGTPRKRRCVKEISVACFLLLVTSWLEKWGENFTEVPRFAQHLWGLGGPPFNEWKLKWIMVSYVGIISTSSNPPPFLRIQQPPPLVTEYYWIPSKDDVVNPLYTTTSSNKKNTTFFTFSPKKLLNQQLRASGQSDAWWRGDLNREKNQWGHPTWRITPVSKCLIKLVSKAAK